MRLGFIFHLICVLLALQLSCARKYTFNKPARGRLVEVVVKATKHHVALFERSTKLQMELEITRKALQVVEHHDKLLLWVRVDVGEQFPHRGAVHKVAAASEGVEKRFSIWHTEKVELVFAALFLALTPVAF